MVVRVDGNKKFGKRDSYCLCKAGQGVLNLDFDIFKRVLFGVRILDGIG